MQNERRKVIECRDIPSESNCTLTFTGEAEDVLNAALEHAVSVHGYRRSPELRERLLELMKDEDEVKVVNL